MLGSSHLGDILGNVSGCVRVFIVGASASPSASAAAVATPSPLMPAAPLLEAPCMWLKPSILLLWDVDIGYWGYLYVAACRWGLIVDRKCCELLHYGRLIRSELLDSCCYLCWECCRCSSCRICVSQCASCCCCCRCLRYCYCIIIVGVFSRHGVDAWEGIGVITDVAEAPGRVA